MLTSFTVKFLTNTILPLATIAADPVGNKLNSIAGSIKSDALLVGATVFLVSVIIAGIMRMISFGSERRIHISNMALTAAVVGLAIMLLSTVLLSAMQSFFK